MRRFLRKCRPYRKLTSSYLSTRDTMQMRHQCSSSKICKCLRSYADWPFRWSRKIKCSKRRNRFLRIQSRRHQNRFLQRSGCFLAKRSKYSLALKSMRKLWSLCSLLTNIISLSQKTDWRCWISVFWYLQVTSRRSATLKTIWGKLISPCKIRTKL